MLTFLEFLFSIGVLTFLEFFVSLLDRASVRVGIKVDGVWVKIGDPVGAPVGDKLGDPINGCAIGEDVIGFVGDAVIGVAIWFSLGDAVGKFVDDAVGDAVIGVSVGVAVGFSIGVAVGEFVDDAVGDASARPQSLMSSVLSTTHCCPNTPWENDYRFLEKQERKQWPKNCNNYTIEASLNSSTSTNWPEKKE